MGSPQSGQMVPSASSTSQNINIQMGSPQQSVAQKLLETGISFIELKNEKNTSPLFTIELKETIYSCHSIAEVVSFFKELGMKGIEVQRYKGLGEMNPDQLWETTLDPEFRSLLKVKIDDAQRADEIFEELMGDDVDKRKIFIQSNAEKVVNLDV